MIFSSHHSYKVGCRTQRGLSFSQISSQNKVFLPFLICICLPLRYTYLIFSRSNQIRESSSLCFTVLMCFPFRYFFSIISCHTPSSLSNFHHHLQRKPIFILEIFLTPIPPFGLLLQMVSHLTRWYFLLVPPCQKNFLLCLSRLSTIVLGKR